MKSVQWTDFYFLGKSLDCLTRTGTIHFVFTTNLPLLWQILEHKTCLRATICCITNEEVMRPACSIKVKFLKFSSNMSLYRFSQSPVMPTPPTISHCHLLEGWGVLKHHTYIWLRQWTYQDGCRRRMMDGLVALGKETQNRNSDMFLRPLITCPMTHFSPLLPTDTEPSSRLTALMASLAYSWFSTYSCFSTML